MAHLPLYTEDGDFRDVQERDLRCLVFVINRHTEYAPARIHIIIILNTLLNLFFQLKNCNFLHFFSWKNEDLIIFNYISKYFIWDNPIIRSTPRHSDRTTVWELTYYIHYIPSPERGFYMKRQSMSSETGGSRKDAGANGTPPSTTFPNRGLDPR